jgi:transcription factor C subunit 6
VLKKDKQKPKPPTDPTTSPAFERIQGPSAIQIWQITGLTQAKSFGFIDYTKAPRLMTVLCGDWGQIKQFIWCPEPRLDLDVRPKGPTELGLLAILWGDGRIRIFDISLRLAKSTQFIHLHSAAWELAIPDTVCTCLDWLSSHLIVAGCANGFVAIWDISNPMILNTPFFYNPLHQGYIVAIKSCYPSRPNLVVSSGVDGKLRLTDIFDPLADCVSSARTVMPTYWISWADSFQSIIASHERTYVNFLPTRAFSGSFKLTRHFGSVYDAAVGEHHPCLLSASADGEATISNPIRRIFSAKTFRHVTQTWFSHEYSSARKLVRIVEGFTVEVFPNVNGATARATADDETTSHSKQALGSLKPRQSKSKAEQLSTDLKDKFNYTLFEGKSAINSVSWNSNLPFAGWAAAGMESGLVKIEDLAI